MNTDEYTGFIVHGFAQTLQGTAASRLAYLGRLDDGRTFAAVYEPFRPHFFVRERDGRRASELLSEPAEDAHRVTMDGEPVRKLAASSVAELRRSVNRLAASGIRTYEADFNATDPFLMDRSVHGSVLIRGRPVEGRHVDLVFRDPSMQPSDWEPRLAVLSLDIETNPASGEVLAVGLVNNGTWSEPVREVHLLGAGTSTPWIREYGGEADLLAGVLARINELDPDIITGWNVIDFDFMVIDQRLRAHGIQFALSRSDQLTSFLESSRDEAGRRQNATVNCPGRQVIDGLRLIRYGPQQFSDRKLDSVAQAVLGEGKTIAATGASKVEAILTLYEQDPVQFAEYCGTDAELVLRILDRTGLLNLTLKRCQFIGISLNRAWTSIPAFEFLYTEALHRRGIVAPSSGVDPLPQGEAPGGAILKPHPGVFRNVMVFDFRSLYPSIMRTFNIDPLGYMSSDEGYADGEPPPSTADAIVAPNGARFRRDGGILPDLLDRFWTERDKARNRGDVVGSFVYKIIMNSFYGVLGSPGCRFAGAPLAGAITGFGQYLLHWTRDRLAEKQYRVLYGDTDSLFVAARDGLSPEEIFETGERLCAGVNSELAQFVEHHYRVESRLQLEFEKVYHRFYLPRIRSGLPHGAGGEARGRAKGYAGLLLLRSGEAGEMEIKGMEAIRSDWTAAAGSLQRSLLGLLFADSSNEAVVDCINTTMVSLLAGELDAELVYSRRLRKSVAGYTRTSPPHVQAARLLPPSEQEGMIEYVITVSGPEPVSRRESAIDYTHYVEKQLRPIAEPVCEVLGIDTTGLFDPSGQLTLF